MLISVCRKENKFFNSSLFQLKRHTDKKALRDKFEAVKIVYEREKCLIKDVIECLFEQSLISATVKNIYEESAEYQQVLNIEIAEITLAVQGLERTLLLSLMKPKSTNLRMNSRRN